MGEIFTLEVLLGNNKDLIKVFEDDEPKELAKAFSVKHGLDLEAQSLIEAELERRIDFIFTVSQKPKKTIEKTLEYSPTESENFDILRRLSDFNRTSPLRISDLQTKKSSPVRLKKYCKTYQFRHLFSHLNPSPQGYITLDRVLQINLKSKICKILMPIIIDIDTCGLNLDYLEFCERLKVLLKFLTREQKEFLMMANQNPSGPTKFMWKS